MRVIFAGTPEFACPALQALIATHEVIAVFTQPDRRAGRGKKLAAPPVKTLAEKFKIAVHQPLSLRDHSTVIAAMRADIMIVVAYGIILPSEILNTPRLGCLNIHASLLPRWRGAAPIQRAIEAGDSCSGVSIMQMEAGLDTGPIFDVAETHISNEDTQQTLHDRLAELGATTIIKTLQSLQLNPQRQPQEQDDAKACYAHKISKHEAAINWQLSAHKIAQKVRAFNPWPVCQTTHQSIRLRLWQVISTNEASYFTDKEVSQNVKPGTVVETKNGLWVACGQGYLNLIRIQRDGGNPITAQQLLNGYVISNGDQLN